MDFNESRLIASALRRRTEGSAGDAHAAAIAEAVVEVLREINESLSPIVGIRGVAALFNRSIHLASATYPWLKGDVKAGQLTIDFDALRLSLAQREGTVAADAGGELFQTFRELLHSFVGPALTEQLLRPAWSDFSSGLPARKAS